MKQFRRVEPPWHGTTEKGEKGTGRKGDSLFLPPVVKILRSAETGAASAGQGATREPIRPYQPVAKVVTAFDRPCIPADGVAIRAHTPGMHPNRALSGGRRNGLGARATFTTDCYVIEKQPGLPECRPSGMA